ncbi:MAG TPA: PQQ-binding-like beta-propeller repeat protein [Tepidisphaeraceae bacterium]|nr:PQQ-binding-like beta-propeller repeat protein [Tepidisphaeraceae bacterium]
MPRISAAVAVLLLPCACLADANWPQFRGPTAQGITTARGLPVTWSEKQNVTWKTPIHGKAWSSPVVWGGQVWLTTATEKGDRLSAICVDKESGRIVHDLLLFEVSVPQYAHPFNSYASPTPAVEDGRVYVTFGSPGTACLDAATGKKIWERRDFVCNHWRGAGSSPVLYKDLLFLPFDGADYQYIVALNKKTGETVWKVDRSVDFQDLDPKTGKPQADGDWRKAFSTPRIAQYAGGPPILVSLGSKALYAYEPETGKELWRVECRESHSGSATPVIGKDLVYFNTGHGRPELWAVKPGGSGVVTDSHVAWKVKRNVPTRASVLLHDDLLYLVDDGGIATCLEAASGKEVWRKRIGGNYSASPLYADGRVYFFSEEGKTTAVAPGREAKVLGESQLDAGFMASPAVADDAFFLRTKTHLYRVEGK